MTGVLVVVALGLILALALVLSTQRRLARRLTVAAQRLEVDITPTGTGLAEATSVVERAVDRTITRGGDMSRAEARLAGALAVIPQGVVVFDAGGGIAFRNRVAAGYLGARHGDALVEEAIDEMADEVIAGRAAVPPRTVELYGPPSRTLVLTAIVLERNAVDLGALVVIDDVTDRRRLEAVRRDFVANISHELKTPIGALGLLAETLLSEDDPAVASRLAERMHHEAFRVGRTIDDLLQLSRIEVEADLERTTVPLSVIITEAVDRVREAAEQRGIELDVEPPSSRLAVSGDRRQLVSATFNLLENAVKYSDPGSTVRLRSHTDGRWIDIEVADDGIGIPDRDRERIFERFYRVDRARSRETGGTGLGLAIVRHIVTNHAGEVRVESREGEGSTFTLRLPAVQSGPVAVSTQAG
ncbi:MAG: sensor histidine kinase [Acidimicrobiales bacterium]